MIKILRTSYLLPAELAETTSRYLDALAESQLSDPFLERLITLLEAGISTLQEALVAVRTNGLVKAVKAADALRDDLFIGLKDLVKAGQRRRGSTFRDAYRAIWPLIEQAGVLLYRESYAEQSGKLKALFAELDKAEYRPHLAALHAETLYAELKQAEAAFVEQNTLRLEEDARKDFPTLEEGKRKTVPYLRRLLEAIDTLDETEPGTYTALIAKLNVITTEVETVALARKTREEEVVGDQEEKVLRLDLL